MAALDEDGGRRWTVDRGRNEKALAITPDGELVTASQDAAGDDPGALLEFWTPDGKQKYRVSVSGAVYSAAIGADGVGCKGSHAAVYHVGRDRQLKTTVDLGDGCPVAAVMDAAGRLVVARPVASSKSGAGAAVEIVALRTASKAAASVGWAMPRGDSRGSGAFTLTYRKR